MAGGGGKGTDIKEKRTFFNFYFILLLKVPTAIKLRGGGAKALMALPLREELLLRLP